MRQGSSPRQGDHLYKSIAGKSYCRNDAAFGSKADIQRPRKHVRLTPESGHVQQPMSAMGQKRTSEWLHSIISSAPASSAGGTVSQSVFAVLTLMMSVNFVGSCTGKSAGLAPLRMRSM